MGIYAINDALIKGKEAVYAEIANSFFQYTRIHPTLEFRSIINLIIVKRDRNMTLKDVQMYRQAKCESHHHLVIGRRKPPTYE